MSKCFRVCDGPWKVCPVAALYPVTITTVNDMTDVDANAYIVYDGEEYESVCVSGGTYPLVAPDSETMTFIRWELVSGSATIDNIDLSNTTVTVVNHAVNIRAIYYNVPMVIDLLSIPFTMLAPRIATPRTMELPLVFGPSDRVVVDWGDGSVDTYTADTAPLIHTYASSNLTRIRIFGSSTGFGTGSVYAGASSITAVNQWGALGVKSLYGAFMYAANLTSVPNTLPSTVVDLGAMFLGASSFNAANISDWDVSRVESMSYMFSEAAAFNQPIDAWDVGRVSDMTRMFLDAPAFNQPLASWNVENVYGMTQMFAGATAFDQDLSTWSAPIVEDATEMFCGSPSPMYGKIERYPQFEAPVGRPLFGCGQAPYCVTMDPSSSVIIVGDISYQSISVPDGSYNIVATVPSGQLFDRWDTTAMVEDISAANTWLTVAGSDVTVTATFTGPPPETYLVTMDPSSSVIIVGGISYQSISVPDGSYNIVATPPSGQVFDQWVTTATVEDIYAADTWLTVEGSDVTVTATFTGTPPVTYLVTMNTGAYIGVTATITVGGVPYTSVAVVPGSYTVQTSVSPGHAYIFNGWNVGGLIIPTLSTSISVDIPPAPTTIIPLYYAGTHIYMDTSGAPGATADISYNGVLYTDNVIVLVGNYTITARTPPGYVFVEWTTSLYGVTDKNSATTTLNIPIPTTHSPVIIRATFAPAPASLQLCVDISFNQDALPFGFPETTVNVIVYPNALPSTYSLNGATQVPITSSPFLIPITYRSIYAVGDKPASLRLYSETGFINIAAKDVRMTAIAFSNLYPTTFIDVGPGTKLSLRNTLTTMDVSNLSNLTYLRCDENWINYANAQSLVAGLQNTSIDSIRNLIIRAQSTGYLSGTLTRSGWTII